MAHDGLVEFLNRCLDEDERIAKDATHGMAGYWPFGCNHTNWDGEPEPPSHDLCARLDCDEITIYDEGGHSVQQAQHIARHDPRSVLADVEAKRRLIDLHTDMHECSYSGSRGGTLMFADDEECPTLLRLASAYRHRDGYKPEWDVQ